MKTVERPWFKVFKFLFIWGGIPLTIIGLFAYILEELCIFNKWTRMAIYFYSLFVQSAS